jgi:hypothetical protein
MTMTDAERFELICNPALARIEAKLEDLHHTVAVSNGKPSVLARVDALEKATSALASAEKALPAPPAIPPPAVRVLKLGPIELQGYGLNDVVRLSVVVVLLWLAVSSYLGQAKTQALIDAMQRAAKVAQVAP